MSAESFFESLPFEPDPFQREAIAAVEAGESVVVTAPTGAGKTLVAEGAVRLALEAGRRAFYTTPIKALSNQKFHDFVADLGEDRVGLLTGDTSINGDGDVVVMTTEVLRNMIYAGSDDVADVGVVVLDEVHYLADRSRGPVWEEVIIHAPQTTALVCLSATISNPRELADWIRERRGATRLVETRHRPVPLEAIYALKDRWGDDRVVLRPIFVDGRPNRAILHQLAERQAGRRGGGRRPPPRRFVTPRRLETVDALTDAEMTPAIYFIFSRKGCEDAARTVANDRRLKSEPTTRRVREIAEEHTAHISVDDLGVLGYGEWLDRLERGVAAHHAGMVPAFKEAVEACFTEGLIDVVFATETLALGINMPARSVVLENLSKFDGESHEEITASEYTQLTGRAGRRGIDDVGYGVVLHSPWIRFDRVADLAGTGASPLVSSFRPTYNMAVNLIANYDRSRAEELLSASFAQFQRSAADARAAEGVELVRAELDEARRAVECDRGDVWEWLAQRGGDEETGIVERLRPGDVIDVPRGPRPGRYMVLRRSTDGPARLDVLSSSGKVAKLPPSALVEGSEKLGWITWKGPYRPRDKRFLQQCTQRLRQFTPRMHEPIAASEATTPTHPVDDCPDREDHARAAATVLRLERRLADAGLPATGSLVAEFDAVLAVLADRGYVDGWNVLAAGERLRRIYSERDLLVAEVLEAGILDDLGPGDLAATLSGFVYDPRGDATAPALPTATSADAAARVLTTWSSLQSEERRERLTETRPPEFGFAAVAYAWCLGADLDELSESNPMSVGDFVRVARQLLDLLRQIRDVSDDLAHVARDAIRGIDRGIVAVGVDR